MCLLDRPLARLLVFCRCVFIGSGSAGLLPLRRNECADDETFAVNVFGPSSAVACSVGAVRKGRYTLRYTADVVGEYQVCRFWLLRPARPPCRACVSYVPCVPCLPALRAVPCVLCRACARACLPCVPCRVGRVGSVAVPVPVRAVLTGALRLASRQCPLPPQVYVLHNGALLKHCPLAVTLGPGAAHAPNSTISAPPTSAVVAGDIFSFVLYCRDRASNAYARARSQCMRALTMYARSHVRARMRIRAHRAFAHTGAAAARRACARRCAARAIAGTRRSRQR